MSWDIYLYTEDKKLCTVDRHAEGGTYAIGGICEADLNVTYNYSPHYYKHLNEEKGLRWLHTKKASETIEALRYAVEKLGTDRTNDYWEATEGNAGYALSILLKWAEQHPDGIWEVS